MEEFDYKSYSKELVFNKTGETIKISLEFKNVSPKRIKLSKGFADVLWNKLEESLFQWI